MRTVNLTAEHVVVLEGRLDVSTAPDVRLSLHEAVDTGVGNLFVDLARLDILDACGLGVLVGAHRRASRLGRTIVLRNIPPAITRLLWVTRLQRVLHIEQVGDEPQAAVGLGASTALAAS